MENGFSSREYPPMLIKEPLLTHVLCGKNWESTVRMHAKRKRGRKEMGDGVSFSCFRYHRGHRADIDLFWCQRKWISSPPLFPLFRGKTTCHTALSQTLAGLNEEKIYYSFL